MSLVMVIVMVKSTLEVCTLTFRSRAMEQSSSLFTCTIDRRG